MKGFESELRRREKIYANFEKTINAIKKHIQERAAASTLAAAEKEVAAFRKNHPRVSDATKRAMARFIKLGLADTLNRAYRMVIHMNRARRMRASQETAMKAGKGRKPPKRKGC